MKIAVMQPYFFPYIGYFDLIRKVDVFVFLTTAQYTRGWINRNRIRSGYFTIPLKKHPQKTTIADVCIAETDWVTEHLNKFVATYGNIQQHPVFKYYSSLKSDYLAPLVCESIQFVSRYLGIGTEFVDSSLFPTDLTGQDRILHICTALGATTYLNLPGGIGLYDAAVFASRRIDLQFIETTPALSILDTFYAPNTNSHQTSSPESTPRRLG